jgi:hypothetical protein
MAVLKGGDSKAGAGSPVRGDVRVACPYKGGATLAAKRLDLWLGAFENAPQSTSITLANGLAVCAA